MNVKAKAERVAEDFDAKLLGIREYRDGYVLDLESEGQKFTVDMDRNGNVVCDDDEV